MQTEFTCGIYTATYTLIAGAQWELTASNEEEIKEASKRGWKLIEYHCLNDPDFELYNQMKLR